MDLVDDLLFGAPDSQESANDLWQDGFDDEQMLDDADSAYETDSNLLDIQDEVTTDSRHLPSNPFNTSIHSTVEPPDYMLMDNIGTCLTKDAFLSKGVSSEQPCDRWHLGAPEMEHALTPKQVFCHRSP